MAHFNYTTSGAKTPLGTQPAAAITTRLQVRFNAALTGNVVVSDSLGTIATITNPIIGNTFEYWDLVGTITINPSTTCDVTVNIDGGRRR